MSENQSKQKASWLNEVMPEPFCGCWDGDSEKDPGDPDCDCGEEFGVVSWNWEKNQRNAEWVDFYENDTLVVFHPLYSSGTAVVKGAIALQQNIHYYWEIKMLTQPYGTDVMIGVGTNDVAETFPDYTTCLGANEDSYGLSYTGAICQNGEVIDDCPGFCKGTIIGVMVNMFHGTLEFYLNREPQGISFTGLRNHKTLFPMIASTAAQTAMRLTYASSWQNSLLINAARVLAGTCAGQDFFQNMPPGLAQDIENDFWLALPSAGRVLEENKSERFIRARVKARRF